MEYEYHSLELLVDGADGVGGSIITDDEKAQEHCDNKLAELQAMLDSLGIQWVHQYFWAADNYYVWIRLPVGGSAKIQEISPDILQHHCSIEETQKTMHGKPISDLFEMKYDSK